MKSKIMIRLSLYFFVSFVIFSLIIGVVFSVLFSRHNVRVHQAELERQAVSVAFILSELIIAESRAAGGMGMRRGMGMMDVSTHLRIIEEMVECSVWVVDRDLEQIVFTGRHRHMQHQMTLYPEELPAYAEQVVIDAFNGSSSTGEGFSELLGTPSITAAAPLVYHNGEVIGAVLLHLYVSNVDIINAEGITILIYSLAGALFISVIIAAVFSSRFTNPLHKMKETALKISGGDYSAQTGVSQSDEIGELAAVLDEMAGKLDYASKESAKLEKLRRDFVANISHELRTPITVIRGSLETLCDGVVTCAEKTASYHGQMLSETMHLERMVTDLLDLARLQNSDFAIEMCPISLKDVIEDAVRSLRGIAERKGIDISLFAEESELVFMGDYGRLRQMFIIVLDNAIKFTPMGKAVYVVLSNMDSSTVITIRDEGCGISEDDTPYIFERFYKRRNENNKSGSGLGLAIAKQIADRHGASLCVTSEQERGSEFSFSFKTPQF